VQCRDNAADDSDPHPGKMMRMTRKKKKRRMMRMSSSSSSTGEAAVG
jgi:hypothetical protein